jgi:hypothetical protein
LASRVDDEAESCVVAIERSQLPVAGVPGAVVEVAAELAEDPATICGSIRAKLDVAARAAGSKTRSGCAQNASNIQSGVSRARDRFNGRTFPQPVCELIERRQCPPVERRGLWHVLGEQPHLSADRWLEGENYHLSASDSSKLLDASLLFLVPVMDRDHRHCGVDAVVAQRQGTGRSPGSRGPGRMDAAQPSHRWARSLSRGGRSAHTIPRRPRR